MTQPFVTIIMPVRNEADFIARSLGAALRQTYPADCYEIIVVDGMSDDATRQVVAELAAATAVAVRLLENPARTTPQALNLGVEAARGAVVVLVGGHCEIAPDYIAACVAALERSGAACVGGAMTTIGQTQRAEQIAMAQSSPFGVGGVAFRTGRETAGYVDTVAFGAYRREVFAQIGGFDEELVRNQDDELNFRLTQAGGKIWLDPAIRVDYFSRASVGRLWRQYYEYGLYKVRVIQKRGAVPSWRHLVPAGFVLALALSLLAAIGLRRPKLALAVAGPYALASAAASLHTARRDPAAIASLPPIFATLHLAYGLGFLAGLWRWRRRRQL